MKHTIVNISAGILICFAFTAFTADKEVVYKEQEGVRISYTHQERAINDQEVMEYLILKIENTNSYPVKLNWKLDLWYNGQCRTCDKPAPTGYEFNLDLKAGEVIQGDVTKDDLMLKIWYKTIKPVRDGGLTKFEFTNLMISKN